MSTTRAFRSLLSLGLIIFAAFSAYAQPAMSTIRHETPNQQTAIVTFAAPLSGSTVAANWVVRVNGIIVPTTSVLLAGATGRVAVNFNVAGLAGHTALEPYLKPGDALTVQFTNPGTLKDATGTTNATSFAATASQNNYMPSCGDIDLLNKGFYSSVDQCAPVVMNFWQWTYEVSLLWRNSSTYGTLRFTMQWGDPSNTASNHVPYDSDNLGNATPTYASTGIKLTTQPVSYSTVRPTFTYPATYALAAPTSCEFTARQTPFFSGLGSCAAKVDQTLIPSYDTDNKNTGQLNYPPLVAGSNLVCLGNNVNMQFVDNTLLNCRLAVEANVPNQAQRYVKIIYGSRNYATPSNIPDIWVTLPAALGGATVQVTNNNPTGTLIFPSGYFPTSVGSADANGAVLVPNPATTNTASTLQGTIFTTQTNNQAVGQRFYVKMLYWDICNQYNGFDDTGAETIENYVEIITKPAPLTTTGGSVCFNGTINNFTVSGTAPGFTAINWYNKNPLAAPALMTGNITTNTASANVTGAGTSFSTQLAVGQKIYNNAGTLIGTIQSIGSNTALTLTGNAALTQAAQPYKAGSFLMQSGASLNYATANYTAAKLAQGAPFTTNNANGKYYSVWATQTVGGTNGCESNPIEVVIYQQPDISGLIPPAPTGLTSLCNGTTGVAYNTTGATPTKTIAISTVTNPAAINFPTENFWTNNFAATVTQSPTTGSSSNADFNLATQPNPSVTNNISVALRYQSTSVSVVSPNAAPNNAPTYTIASQVCTTTAANLAVTVFGLSVGGNANSNQTICEGTAPAAITLSGQKGTVQYWEKAVNGGAYVPDVSLGTGTSIAPVVPIVGGLLTTYDFRAVVQNGPCATATSASARITVNPKPTTATISLTGAGTICKGSSTSIKIDLPAVGAGGGTPNYTIVYRANGTNQAAINNYVSGSNITVSPTVNTTYDLFSVTDSKGCTAGSLVGSVTVLVKDLRATISTDGPTALCPPPNSTTIKVTITDVNANPLSTYTVNYKDNLAGTYTTGAGYVSGNPITVTNVPNPGLTYTITSVTEDGLGCTTSPNTGSAVITVGAPISAAAFSGGGSVCLGSTKNLVLTITGGVSPYTIQVTPSSGPVINNAAYTSGSNIAVPTGAAGSISYSATLIIDACGFSFPLGSITGNPQVVVVNPLPTANNQTPTVCSTTAGGTTAVVDLTALQPSINGGGGISYAWFTSYNAGTKVFSGAIATPASATVTNATAVFCRVTDGNGCVSPATVTYTVNPRPAAPTGATGSTYCSTGSPTAISVAAPGGSTTIDWYAAASGGVALATNTVSYTAAAAGTYFAEARDTGTGCLSTTRTAVTLTMDTSPATASAGPAQPNVCSSAASVTMAATAVGSGGNGSWTVPGKVAYFQNFTNFANGVTSLSGVNGWSRDVSGNNSFANTVTNTNATGGYFEVRNNKFEAHNTNGDKGAGAANTATVTWTSPVIDITGMSAVQATMVLGNNCSGGEVLDGGLDADFVQIQYSLNGAPPVNFNTNGLINTTTLPAFATSGATANATAFAAPVTGSTLQLIVKVSVNNQNERINIDNIVVKDPASSISFSDANSATAVVTGLPAPADGAAPVTTTLQWTTASALGVCATASTTVAVTINPAPKVAAAQNPIVCSGSAVNYEIKLSPTLNFPVGSTLSWPDPDGAGPATAKTNLAADPAGTFHITDVLTNTTGANINVTYVVTPTSSLGCVGVATNVVVTVRPSPTIVPAQAKTICSGQNVNYEILLSPANQPAGTTLSWPDPDGAGPATAKSIAADPAGTKHITDVLVNGGAAPLTVTYVVTPVSAAGCVGTPQNVVVTVNPLPAANTITGGGTVCAGTTILLYQVTPNAGSTYAWSVPPLFTKFGGGTPTDFFVLLQFPTVGSGTLQMTETNSYGCTGTANTLPITVASAPGAIVINGNSAVCKNETGVTYSVSAGTFNPTSTYNWTASGATITSASSGVGLQTITVDFGLSASATINVSEVSVSGCTGSPQSFNVVVSDNPVMTSANSESICSGGTPTLNFAATPASTFNWTVTSITGSITAATVPALAVGKTGTGNLSATFTGATALTNNSSAVGSVTFDVTPVSTALPNCVGTTQSVVITVNPKPSIPNLPTTVCSGTAFVVSPADGGANIVPTGTTYTWTPPTMSGGLTGGTGVAVGQPTISQTLINSTNVNQTAIYTVTPTSGAAGSCVGATFTVTVTVTPKPAIPTQNVPICSGDTFTVTPADGVPSSATIVPAGTTYTWLNPVVTGGITGGTAQPVGQVNISQTLTNPTNTVQTAQYTVTPSAGGCAGSTFIVNVTVNPTPVIPNQTAAICSGGTFTVTPANNPPATIVPAGITYSWPAPVVTGGLTGGSAQAGQTSISQTLTNPTNSAQTAVYTVTPVVGTCTGTVFTVTVTVNPVPVVPNQPVAVCSGSSFSVSPTNSPPGTIIPAGITYSWPAPAVTGGLTGGTAQSNQISISQTLTNPTNAQQTAIYTVTPTAGTCSGASFLVTVSVNPMPLIGNQTAAVCSGSAFTVAPVNSAPTTIVPAGITYAWGAPVVTGGVTGGSAQAGQATISQVLVNPTNTAQTAIYTVTPTAGTCVGTPFTVTVTVNPMPLIPVQAATICSGSAFTVTPSNSPPGTIVPVGITYSWPAPVVTGGLTGGSAQAGQTSISQTLTNPTNTAQTAVYTVTPTVGSCTGTNFVVTVNVNPMPIIGNQTASVCSGSAFSVTPVNSPPGTIVPVGIQYSWPAPTVSGGLTGGSAQSNQTSISQLLTNPTNTSQTAIYTVTPSVGGCTGATFTVTVTINPLPIIGNQSATVCSGTAFSVTPANNPPGTIVPTGITYSWGAPLVSGGVTGGSAQAGQTSISQTLSNPTNVVQTATYTVTPTAGTCVGSTFTVSVSINPKPAIANTSTSICSGNSFTVSPTNGGATIVPAGTTYTWANPVVTGGVTGGSSQTGQTNISQTLTNPTNSPQTATYTVIPTSGAAGACVGSSFTITVNVNPVPVIPAQTASVCSGSAFTVTPVDGFPSAATIVPTGTTYTWAVPVVTGGMTGGTAQAVGVASISQTLTNPTNSPQTATYTVIPKSGAVGTCTGVAFTVTITVNPKPVIPDQPVTICSDDTFVVSPANGGATIVPTGTTYSWPAPIVTGGVSGGSAQSGQTNISQTLSNPTNAAQTATYTVTPTSGAAGSCVGATFTVTVTVNPKPVAQALSSITRCSGQPINFNLQDIINNVAPFVGGNSVASNFKYSVVADFPLDLSPAVFPGTYDRTTASNASITETFSNYSNHDVTLTYTVTPYSLTGTCAGSPFIFKVVYHPEPVGSNFSEPNCNTVLNHNIQTQITNGLTSVFTYTVSQAPLGALVLPADRVVASSNPITDAYVNNTGSPVVVTYTITAFNQAFPTCAGTATFTYSVTISPRPIGADTTVPAVCSDIAFSVDPQTFISPAVASTFTWTATYGGAPIAGGTGLLAGTFTNTSNASKDVVYTITPTAVGSGCIGSSFQVTVPINPEPVMDPTLASPSAVCSSNAVSNNPINVVLGTNGVSIAAASYIVVLKSQDAGLTGTPTVGTFPAVAGFSNAIRNDIYRNTTAAQLKVVYTVTPQSAAGCNGDPFDISVSVNPEPVVSSPGNTVCSTLPSDIVLSTNGTSVGAASYKLIAVTVPGTVTADPGNISVGTSAGVNLIKNDKYTNVTNAPATVIYEIQGTSATGCVGESSFVNLIINPAPVLDPALSPTPVCSGVASGVTMGVAPTSVGASTYNINSIIFPGLTAGPSNQGIGTGKPANYIANDSYTNITNGPLTVTYSITPVSAAGCVGPTGTIILTINPSPDLASLNKTVCSGSASGITLSIANAVGMGDFKINTITVQPGLVAAGGNATTGAGKAANAIAADVFTNPTNGVLTVTYNIQPRSAANCFGPAEDVVLSIEPTIIAAPVNNKASICSNSASTNDPTDIVLVSPVTPSSGNVTFSYTAALTSGTNTSGFIAAGLTNLAQNYHIQDNLVNTSNSPAVVTYTITPDASGARGGLGCSGSPVTVAVTVEPKPKLVATPAVKTVCEGTSIGIALTSPTTPSAGTIEFLLVNAIATGGVTGASPNGTVFANSSTITDALSNPTATPQTVTYTLRPRINGGAGCIGDDVTVTITVNPSPVVTATPQAPICNGDQVDITLTADVANTVSTWTVAKPATVSGASAGAGDRIFQILFNSGNIVETVTYTVTPIANGCAGTPLVINVQVSPKAKVTGVPTTVTVCHGGTLNIPLTSNVAGATFAWTVDDPSGLGVPLTGSGNTINQVINNTLGFQANLTYTITPTGPGPGPGCVGESKIVIVTVSPQITAAWLNTPSPDYLCSGNTEYLIFSFGGQAPFDFTYDEGGAPITVTGKGAVAVIARNNMTTTTTFTIRSVKDALGCTSTFNIPFTVNVGVTDPNYSIITPTATCSPNQVSFQYNQVAGTIYTWRFGDSADSVYTAATTVANKVIKHTYTNLSPTSTLSYPVTMQTELPAPFPGCVKTTAPKTITIYPKIITNVLSDKTEICSGEAVQFLNQSVGATSQTWSYRVLGQVAETSMGVSPSLSYVFTNNTTSNPIVYEVIYRGTNGNCPSPDVIIPIQVYRSVVADLNPGAVPPYVNGQSIVNVTNTSTPIDGTAFTYDWNFGTDSSPQTFTGTTPPAVTYVRPGSKTITLAVTNVLRSQCKSEVQKTISVDLLPLTATFTIGPVSSCSPAKVAVTSSTITGDVVEWKVQDDNGRVVATSSGMTPTFNIPTEGHYTVTLRTSSSLTGQFAVATPQSFVVYGKPIASFDSRPDLVYVPDQELTTYNFSFGANQYLWDFGDGGTSTLEEPTHVYKVEGLYDITLIAQNDHGGGVVCADTLKHQVTARLGGVTKVPNAFTPNPNGPSGGSGGSGGGGGGGGGGGSGGGTGGGSSGGSTGSFNDVFLPIVKGAEEFNLQIFDRWGNLIFESNDNHIGWDGYGQDGRILPAGVYVYKLTVRLSDGQRSTQIGDVTMIR